MNHDARMLLEELESEHPRTERLLERCPQEHLTWRPHERSMTLGQLALHTATIPAALLELTAGEGFDAREADFDVAQPATAAELRSAQDASLAAAREVLGAMDDGEAQRTWRLVNGADEVFAQPRIAVLRSLLMSHLLHHRGQLTVYLRLLDVPLPATYGRSADESPFG